ncbi:hypothetical protein TRVA0_004S02982 [Trichomonascus vanleenenianus]|uniref:Rsa4p n=1 Tax=Trichomonascus vanleenenianus TaxID=2268995 RepID=UPI003ECBAF3C
MEQTENWLGTINIGHDAQRMTVNVFRNGLSRSFYMYAGGDDDEHEGDLWETMTNLLVDSELYEEDFYQVISDLGMEEYDQEPDFVCFLNDMRLRGECPKDLYDEIYAQLNRPMKEVVTPEDLEIDPAMDCQGIRWPARHDGAALGVRERRKQTFRSQSHRELMFYYPSHNALRCERNRHDTIRLAEDGIFAFKQTFTRPKPSLVHFQLRNLLIPVSSNEIYYYREADRRTIERLNPSTGTIEDVFEPSALLASMQVSVLGADAQWIVAGGFRGQYLVKSIETGEAASGTITCDANGITNHVLLPPHTDRAVFSSNDTRVRTLDMVTNRFVHTARYPWAVNCMAQRPGCAHVRLVVGDSVQSWIVDDRTGNSREAALTGHSHYGFACAWSPNGHTVATGNQDGTCRLYDLRYLHQDRAWVLPTQLDGAVRNTTFDETGRYLAYSEPIDYTTVVDVNSISDPPTAQVLEVYGHIVGLGFTGRLGQPTLTIGCSDRHTGNVVQYEKIGYDMLDDLVI